MHIAHQYDEAAHARLRAVVPEHVRLTRLDPDHPWNVPTDVDALLSSPQAVGPVRRGRKPAEYLATPTWLHLRSTGIDGLPDWLLSHQIVTVSRGAQAAAISEYILAAMLSVAKKFPDLWVQSAAEWSGQTLGGLAGQTLGIVGYGSIGREAAKRALAFDMRVVGCQRTPKADPDLPVEILPFEKVLSTADYLALCTPLTAQTRHIINANAFARMRPHCHLINIARGALIDEAALRTALDTGQIAGATLDVWSPEPIPEGHWAYDHAKIRVSAHISHSGPITAKASDAIMFGNIAAWIEGRTDDMHGQISRDAGY